MTFTIGIFLKIYVKSQIGIFWCGWGTEAIVILWYIVWTVTYFVDSMWSFTERIHIGNLPYFFVEFNVDAIKFVWYTNFFC